MFRFKMALKAALVPSIIGLVASIIGIVLVIIGFVTETFWLTIIGVFILFLGGAGGFGAAYAFGKRKLDAICPECQKFMGDTDKEVNYSYVFNQYKENYDNNTGKLRDYTFYYTCTIVCPHCGSSAVFEYKTNEKSQPKADARVNKYLISILKQEK